MSAQDIILYNEFENYTFKITATPQEANELKCCVHIWRFIAECICAQLTFISLRLGNEPQWIICFVSNANCG